LFSPEADEIMKKKLLMFPNTQKGKPKKLSNSTFHTIV
jgi:hypothetical protein